MDVFVDLGENVGEENVVAVNDVLEHEIDETERCDERTDDAEAERDGEHGQQPGVLDTVVELERCLLEKRDSQKQKQRLTRAFNYRLNLRTTDQSTIQALGRRSGPEKLDQVQEEIGQSKEIQGRADKATSSDVFQEKCPIIADASPFEADFVLVDPLKYGVDARQSERGQDEDHEEEESERFDHH